MGILNEDNLYARNIYLIGTASLGPINYPVLAKSVNQIRTIFGAEGNLTEAYSMIVDTDIACNVYLVKTAGSHAEVYLNVIDDNSNIIENGFYIKSRHATGIANNIEILLDDNFISFIYPIEFGGHSDTFYFSNYNTLFELASAINENTKVSTGEVFCIVNCGPEVSCNLTLSPINNNKLKLSGGNDGLEYTKDMLFNSMKETYSALEGLPTDIIVPLDMFYDDTYTDNKNLLSELNKDKDYIMTKDESGNYNSFYKQLLKFCSLQMQSGIIPHGVMGISTFDDYNLDPNYFLNYLNIISVINVLDIEDEHLSHMVSITVNDLYAMYGTLVTNSYIAYAVLLSSIKVDETTTNKSVPISFILQDFFDMDVLKKITDMGFVSFRNSPLTREIHVLNGITKSKHEQLKYICNSRTIQIVMKNIREALLKYIGTNIGDLLISGQLDKELYEIIKDLSGYGIIKTVSSIRVYEEAEDSLSIEMSFSTRYMTEEIKTYGGLSSNIGVF